MGKIFKGEDILFGSGVRVLTQEIEELFSPAAHTPPVEPEEEEEQPDPEAIRQAIMEEARLEAEQKVQEAYQEGYRRGMEAGEEAFQESIAHCAEALNAAAEQMLQARQEFLDDLEPQVVEAVALIARKVLQREANTDRTLIVSTVEKALRILTDRQHCTIHVNPEDLEALRLHEVALLENFSGLEALELDVDPDITPGGCRIASRTMQVDARMETLLDNVLERLQG